MPNLIERPECTLVQPALALRMIEGQPAMHQGALWTFDQVRHRGHPRWRAVRTQRDVSLQVFWDLLDILAQLRHVSISTPRTSQLDSRQCSIGSRLCNPDGGIPLL